MVMKKNDTSNRADELDVSALVGSVEETPIVPEADVQQMAAMEYEAQPETADDIEPPARTPARRAPARAPVRAQ